MKRHLVYLTALLLVLLTACGGSGNTASDAGEMEGQSTNTSVSTADTAGGAETFEEEPQAAGESRFQNAKLIHTAHLEVETTAFDAAAADLETLVGELGGYFEYAAVNSYSSGYRSGTYTVRVPTGQFEVFLDQVGELCHVVYQEKDSENISEAYYDTESRLVTQKTKLERLQELLGQAETMEDIITIESAISETELAIEQLTGTLHSYDALVDFATVHLSLEEVYQLSNVEQAPQGFGDRVGGAFSSGWSAFVTAQGNLVVALAYGWVWVLLLAVIVAAVVRILRKRRPETGDRPEKPWHTKK